MTKLTRRKQRGSGCGCELPAMTGGGCSIEGFSACPLPQTGGARRQRKRKTRAKTRTKRRHGRK
jgi:hypothetical protein